MQAVASSAIKNVGKFLAAFGLLVVMLWAGLYPDAMSIAYLVLIYISIIVGLSWSTVLRRRPHKLLLSLVVLFFFAATASVLLQGLLFGSEIDVNGVNTYDHALATLAWSYLFFLLGCVFLLPTDERSGVVIIPALLVLLAVLFHTGLDFLNYEELSSLRGEVSHLTIADPVLLTMFLLYAYAGKRYRLVVLVVGLSCLMTVQSRSALFIGTLATLLVVSGVSRVKGLVIGGAVLFGYLFAETVRVNEFRPELERILFTHGFLAAGSGAVRLEQMHVGLIGLPDQLLLGDFNYVVRNFGQVGAYMHNFLSYWQQYGAIAWVLFCAALITLVKAIWLDIQRLQHASSPAVMFRALVATYSVCSVVISKAYTFKWVWLAVGIYSLQSFRESRLELRSIK